tara:strand:+ start:705 stop:1280 length:576 start_codon:yes stop_codon:yes gene_type:complete
MKLGIMCSGNGTNFENIIRTCRYDEVVLMIHNKKKCGAVKRAAKFGINHCYINAKNEDQMIKLFEAYKVDLIVLAGYMRIIKNPSAFPCPLINVHPSLLPKYKGLNAIEQAMDAGEKVTGCTVHYVNEELDGGETILQAEVPILPDDDIISLTKAVQRKEYAILPQAIEHVKNELQKQNNRHLLSNHINRW